jgi:hypothetical protein
MIDLFCILPLACCGLLGVVVAGAAAFFHWVFSTTPDEIENDDPCNKVRQQRSGWGGR